MTSWCCLVELVATVVSFSMLFSFKRDGWWTLILFRRVPWGHGAPPALYLMVNLQLLSWLNWGMNTNNMKLVGIWNMGTTSRTALAKKDHGFCNHSETRHRWLFMRQVPIVYLWPGQCAVMHCTPSSQVTGLASEGLVMPNADHHDLATWLSRTGFLDVATTAYKDL